MILDYDNLGIYFVSDGGCCVWVLKEVNKELVKVIVIDVLIGI